MSPDNPTPKKSEKDEKSDNIVWGTRVQNPEKDATKLQKIEQVLKDKGMDSRSTMQALQMIDEILYPQVTQEEADKTNKSKEKKNVP